MVVITAAPGNIVLGARYAFMATLIMTILMIITFARYQKLKRSGN